MQPLHTLCSYLAPVFWFDSGLPPFQSGLRGISGFLQHTVDNPRVSPWSDLLVSVSHGMVELLGLPPPPPFWKPWQFSISNAIEVMFSFTGARNHWCEYRSAWSHQVSAVKNDQDLSISLKDLVT